MGEKRRRKKVAQRGDVSRREMAPQSRRGRCQKVPELKAVPSVLTRLG